MNSFHACSGAALDACRFEARHHLSLTLGLLPMAGFEHVKVVTGGCDLEILHDGVAVVTDWGVGRARRVGIAL